MSCDFFWRAVGRWPLMMMTAFLSNCGLHATRDEKHGQQTTVVGDQPEELKEGSATVSPDGKYVARLGDDPMEPTISIEERGRGRQWKFEGFIPSVYAMIWTPDSDGLIVVDHIAHGRRMHAIARKSNDWVKPDSEIDTAWGSGIAPLRITPMGRGVVHFSFGSTDWYSEERHRRDETENFFLSSFDYDLKTGTRANDRSRGISRPEAKAKGMSRSLSYPPPILQRLRREVPADGR